MGEAREPDFTGWATKYNMECSDGRTIKPGAFKHMDKVKVPLVWMHQHDNPENVLGHAILEDRAFGVYAQAFFNDSDQGRATKTAVSHGDITSLSVYANNLSERKQSGRKKEVYHGDIKELSVVLAGANPGALIENINLIHGDTYDVLDDEAIIYSDDSELKHSDADVSDEVAKETKKSSEAKAEDDKDEDDASEEEEASDDLSHADEETIEDVFNTLSEKQKNVVLYMIGSAAGETNDSEDDSEESDDMAQSESMSEEDKAEFLEHFDNAIKERFTEMGHRNVFDQSTNDDNKAKGSTLSHSQMATVLAEAKKGHSLRDYLQDSMGSLVHGDLAHEGTYGIDEIDYLFPDHKDLDGAPQFIKRQTEWVPKVIGAVKKSPFSRIKSIVADITAPEARAKGYVKGTMKKDEVIGLLRRTTSPTTVYKKQKLDRDDIVDITNFDVVAWLKAEIRLMLEEELGRAILIGDGRGDADEDHIKDPKGALSGEGVRSIYHDADMYAHKAELPANVGTADMIKGLVRSRTAYRGSGSPTLYTTDSVLTDLLLLEDKFGRRLYETEASLAAVLRVKEIVTVEVMEELPRLLGIIVNLVDYTLGADRGGEISFFSDFDIDFNQNKYLMETRVSGALTRPKSAIVVTRDQGTAAIPSAPSFEDNTITIPNTTGVIYTIDDEPVTGDVDITEDTVVEAVADEGYYIPSNTTVSWSYTYTA